MPDTNQNALPASWLGFKLINQAAADDMGASVLPSDKSLSGRVWVALTDADGDALYVAGIVVGVSFTASAVRYSIAFPVAPQPREGVTMYAVVDGIESSIVLDKLPEDETLFDAVLTEDAAALLPVVKLEPAPVPVLDSANTLLGGQLEGELTERKETLESAIRIDSDPLYILGVARDVISLAQQVRAGERAPVVELDPTEWPGYAAVLKDEALAIKWQDRLDSFFQKRLIDVRNALRELGWTGGQREALSKNGIIARFDFWQVGAGKNVVGMTINGIRDDLRLDVLELAAAIDATAALPEPAGPSEQFQNYRAYIEKELAEGRAITAGMLEQIRRDERLNDGEAAQLEALAAASPTTSTEKPSMDTLIKIAADSLAQLRRIDVYRVLNSAGDQRADLATYIATGRADLVREVTDVMAEEWPELGWAMTTAVEPDPAAVDLPNVPSAELKAAVLSTVFAQSPKAVEPVSGWKYLAARMKGSGRGVYVVDGTFDRATFKVVVTEAREAGLDPTKISIYGRLGTYSGDSITFTNLNDYPALQATAPEPDPQPEPANPQRAADMAFLSSVISASVDMWADDLSDKIEALGTTYEGDAEVLELWGSAIEAYTNFMVKAMG